MILAFPCDTAKVDETLERLINMTNQTCVVGLDRTLKAVEVSLKYNAYSVGFSRVSSLAERITKAADDIALTLPPAQRTVYVSAPQRPTLPTATVLELRRPV